MKREVITVRIGDGERTPEGTVERGGDDGGAVGRQSVVDGLDDVDEARRMLRAMVDALSDPEPGSS